MTSDMQSEQIDEDGRSETLQETLRNGSVLLNDCVQNGIVWTYWFFFFRLVVGIWLCCDDRSTLDIVSVNYSPINCQMWIVWWCCSPLGYCIHRVFKMFFLFAGMKNGDAADWALYRYCLNNVLAGSYCDTFLFFCQTMQFRLAIQRETSNWEQRRVEWFSSFRFFFLLLSFQWLKC